MIRRQFRKALSLLTLPALAAAMLVSGTAAANDDEPAASAVLGNPPQFDGMAGHPGDINTSVETASTSYDGRSCWRADPSVGNDYLYFRVDDDRVPENATEAIVTVEYFDAGEGNFTIHYDGEQGSFTKAATVDLTGAQAWTTHQFALSGVRFDGRTNSHDFRIANWDSSWGGRSPTPVCVASISVEFSVVPALALTSESLIFTSGDAGVDVSSTATEVIWEVSDEHRLGVASGMAAVDDGHGAIDLSDLGPGYYHLDVTANFGTEQITRSSSLGIITPLPDGAIAEDEPFGVGTHFPHGWDLDLIPLIADIGFSHIRDEVYWSHVEDEPGVYTFPSYTRYVGDAAAEGITPLFVATYANGLYEDGKTPSTPEGQAAYARYASAVVEHMGGDLSNVEVFNEFNHSFFNDGDCGLTPDCYLPLLRTTSERLRADHPGVTVAGPATSTAAVAWIKRLIDLGGLEYVDAISTHPYRFPGTPETGLAGEIKEIRDYIWAHNDGEDKGIWITEIGWPTFTGSTPEPTQADYLIRTYALALSAGATRLYWYDFLEDGNDPDSREHNYGIVRRPQEGVNGFAPKPAVIAAAVMIRALAGKDYAGADDLGEPIYSYKFGTGDDVTRVQWATEPRTVLLVTDEPVEVTDRYGRTQSLTPIAGGVQVDLTGHPVFIDGSIDDVTVMDEPAYSVTAPERIAVGESLPVTFTVDRTDPRSAPGEVTFRVGGVDTVIRAEPGEVSSATVELPASEVVGERTITAEVLVGRARARVVTVTDVAPTTELSVVPVMEQVSPLVGEVSIEVANNSAHDTLQISAASWTIGELSGSADQPVPIEPGQTGVVSVPMSEAVTWDGYPYDVTVTLADGTVLEDSGTVSFGPVMPAGDTTVPPIDLETQGHYRPITVPFEGPDDLSGTVRVNYTEEALLMTAEITDDVFSQTHTPADMWLADSIQVGVSPALPGKSPTTMEFGVALFDDGPVVYNLLGGIAGHTPGAAAEVTREGTTTTYEISVPWTSLEMEGAPDGPFAFSFLFNDDDNDGAGRAGWVQWASGIGSTKSTSLYWPVELVR